MAADGILSATGAGVFALLNTDTGAAPGWSSGLGSAVADGAGITTNFQFGLGCQFRLTDLPNPTEFTSLFNEYRIEKVSFRVTPLQASVTDDTVGSIAAAYIAWDPNDATPPPDTPSMQQRDTTKLVEFIADQPIITTGTPRCAQAIYSSAMATSYGYTANKSLWIDTTSPSNGTPHYGLKFYFRNMPGFYNSGFGLRFQPTYHLVFRRTR